MNAPDDPRFTEKMDILQIIEIHIIKNIEKLMIKLVKIKRKSIY
jgi:hypothetical protein